jgi:hypothetical protein
LVGLAGVLAAGGTLEAMPAVTPPPDFRYSGRLAATLGGDVPLHVVGESYRQDTLWRLAGGRRPEPVRQEIVAVLLPEDNEHDANAVAVLIDDQLVGYLARADAARYRPGVEALIDRLGVVALPGVILGSGQQPDGLGLLGVVLRHDPVDFGIARVAPGDLERAPAAPLPQAMLDRAKAEGRLD